MGGIRNTKTALWQEDESCRSAEFLFWLIQISDSRMLMMVLDASYSIEMM